MKILRMKQGIPLIKGNGVRSRLVRGALGVGGLKLLSLPLTLLISVLMARGLGPEGFGQYAFVIALITILSLPFGRGLGQLITREVAKYHKSRDWASFRGLLRRAHQWVLIGAAALSCVIIAIASVNAKWAFDDRWTLLFIACCLFPLLGLNAIRTSTLRGMRFVSLSQLPELLIIPGVQLLMVCVLVIMGMLNPASAIASQIVAMGSGFLVGAWILHRLRPQLLKEAEPVYKTAEWGKAILPFSMLAAMTMMNSQVGILILGWLSTNEEVAALRVAQSGAILVLLSLTIVNQVIAPYVTRAHADGDKVALQRLSRRSAQVALLVSLPMALPLIFAGEPIVRLVYGPEYVESSTIPLAFLALGQLVNVAFGSVGLFLVMSGHEKDSLKGQVFALLANIVVVVLLVPSLGAIGAAIGVGVGLLVFNILLAVMVYQRLGIGVTAFPWIK